MLKTQMFSYKQWKVDNIAPQVVFEINSPSNAPCGDVAKVGFYQNYGVQEYYNITFMTPMPMNYWFGLEKGSIL